MPFPEADCGCHAAVSNGVRLLVTATVFVGTVTGYLSEGFVFLPLAILQIGGALVAGRFPRTREAFAAFVVTYLSLAVLPLAIGVLHHLEYRANLIAITGAALSILLVVLSDVALVVEGFKGSSRRAGAERAQVCEPR